MTPLLASVSIILVAIIIAALPVLTDLRTHRTLVRRVLRLREKRQVPTLRMQVIKFYLRVSEYFPTFVQLLTR